MDYSKVAKALKGQQILIAARSHSGADAASQ